MRDKENPSFSHTTESVFTGDGLAFQREKFNPRIQRLRSHFGPQFTRMRLLDVGVGYGTFLHLLEREYGLVHLWGMDPHPGSLTLARDYTFADLRLGDINSPTWPFNPRSFAIITSFDVIEHLERPAVFLQRARRYLEPGGVVMFTTPNRQLPYRLRALPWVGKPDTNPTHINVHSPTYWCKLAQHCGYRILEAWTGEHLTHLKVVPDLLGHLCQLLRLDPSTAPLVSQFQQSFGLLLTPSPSTGSRARRYDG